MDRMLFVAALALLLVPALSGCVYDEDADVKIAFSYKLTDLVSDKDPRRLAEWVEGETGRSATVYQVDDNTAALEALRFGQAEMAFLDGAAAWLGWQRFGLEAIAADQKADGRTFYMASAWVRADSDIQTPADLEGRDSCHTGLLKSAGMLLPMGYLVREGIVDKRGYPDEIHAVEDMVHDFFGTATIGGAYGGYQGALRCLSDGTGDVAFVRDTTPEDYCGDKQKDWCLDLSEYRKLVEFGPSPSHPVMVPGDLPEDRKDELRTALLALNDSPEGRAILEEVLETPGVTAVETEAHLGDYGDLVSILPGFTSWQEEKHEV